MEKISKEINGGYINGCNNSIESILIKMVRREREKSEKKNMLLPDWIEEERKKGMKEFTLEKVGRMDILQFRT